MRNNVPKIHELSVFDPKQLIIELEIWHYFQKPPTIPSDVTKEATFDPSYYFITSGEAIEKINFMLIDLDERTNSFLDIFSGKMVQLGNIKKPSALKQIKENKQTPKSLNDYKTYYDYMVSCKKAAKSLLQLLKKFRGKNCFLETEWDSHRLLCISKNPRMKDEIDES